MGNPGFSFLVKRETSNACLPSSNARLSTNARSTEEAIFALAGFKSSAHPVRRATVMSVNIVVEWMEC